MHNNVLVSPSEPWIVPKKALVKVTGSAPQGYSTADSEAIACPGFAAAIWPNAVAPLKPSTAVQTLLPEICSA